DARTGGTLTCDRAPTPGETCLLTTSVPVPAVDPVTGRIDPNLPPELVTGVFSPAEDYLLPSPDDTAHPGLVPGLYTVTLSAPGYEPASTSVQVAQGQIVPAPQVSLSPLGMLTGRLTTRVGTPTGITCVAVTPTGVDPPAAGSSCVPKPDGIGCIVSDDPSINCGLVQPDGTYQVRGLVHGGYTVVVLPSDPEYIAPAPFDIQLELGSDAQYDPVLDRLGRFAITVLQPDDATAELGPPDQPATVTASDAGGVKATATSAPDGSALLTGLLGQYALTATSGPGGLPGSATIPAATVQLNQTVDLIMVLTSPIGTVIGQIVTNDGGVDPVGVDGARVRITGIIGYNGVTPVYAFADLTTDDNGCFAIVPDQATRPPERPTAGCPTPVTEDGAIGPVSVPGAAFIGRPVSVAVFETDKTQGTFIATVGILDDPSGDGLKTLPVTRVNPKPSPTTGLTLLSNPATGPPTPLRAAATITVLSRPPGSGDVGITESITPAGVSTLTWTDTTMPAPNLAAPGVYTIQATLPGWGSGSSTGDPNILTGTVRCPLGLPCFFEGAFTLVRNPTFVGRVQLLPTTDGANPALGTYSVIAASAPAPVTITATASGELTWQELGAPANLIRPGQYQIAGSLAGYESRPLAFSCGQGPGNCVLPAPLTLSRPAQPTLELRSTGGIAPVGASVRLTGDSIGAYDLLAPANSTFVPFPSLSTFDTSYAVQVRAAGFQTLTVPLSAANCTGPPGSPPIPGAVVQPGVNACVLTLTQLGRIPVRTWQSSPNTATSVLSAVAVSAQQVASTAPGAPTIGDPFPITTGGDGTGLITGSLTREGLVDGAYRITATKAGYLDATGVVQIIGHTLFSAPPAGFAIDATGALTIVLQVKPIAMQVQLVSNGVPILPAGSITVRGNNITRTCTLVTTGTDTACVPPDPGTTVVTGANASITFGDLYPAVYTVTFTSTDNRYRNQSIQTQLLAVDVQPPVVMFLDLRASTQTGIVLNPAGQPVAGAAVSMRPNANVEAPANDIDGAPLVTTTDTAGQFSFAKVPDLQYRVMVDATGWDRFFSPMIEINSALTTTPPSVTERLTTRQNRAVEVTLTSTAGAVNLGGAAVTFEPVAGTQPPGTPP
ncbi:MAG: carboxypeptidase regulatory-like domain-containing protein, partial [Nakamurella sp.]